MLRSLFIVSTSFLWSVHGCLDAGAQIEFPEGFYRARNDSSTLGKRWAAIVPGVDGPGLVSVTSNSNGERWPQSTIPVCINPNAPTVRADAELAIKEGITVWHHAGVDPNVWNVLILSVEECERHGVVPGTRRKNFLWVERVAGNGSPHATLGNVRGGSYLRYQPKSYWTDIPGSPLAQDYNFRLSMAHELGHVFGLVHEHQRPDAWGPHHAGSASDEGVFEFHCNRLRDYQECLTDASENLPFGENYIQNLVNNQLCRFLSESTRNSCQGTTQVTHPDDHFLMARNYLPYPGGASYIQTSAMRSLDLTSVMIYSSMAGAAGDEPVYTIRRESEYYDAAGTGGPDHPNQVRPGIPSIRGSFINFPTNADVFAADFMSPNPAIDDEDRMPFFNGHSPFLSLWDDAMQRRLFPGESECTIQ
ncbi:hypothetical protein QBC34DRAFT_410414 [Podospora aff. communis PSN243]|uniref:Peptidase metallopeptidase domain-containing protein n=1 Tax=Podospora aff. communis PSN243 TaxID=3040156 RepID=A0AAV9GE26_9PEZI|nr:hypothetical protein QBC34DRAFT_410414 [Podospora aff. communis PSN243]